MNVKCSDCGQLFDPGEGQGGDSTRCLACYLRATINEPSVPVGRMRFKCPDCGEPLELSAVFAGRVIDCPACDCELRIPELPSEEVPAEGVSTSAPLHFSEKGTPAAPREGPDPAAWISSMITDAAERKYKMGLVVASGGQGTVVRARDMNLRRGIAMKVLLNPDKAGKKEVLRFVEEAQITSQLQHPGIIPIHELGRDSDGNVFYTMKYVRGMTLHTILDGIKNGDTVMIREYPLSRLLLIFQRVCDAVAFAHSRRVVHRDLKPANIMVGDYGEVQVMDWGLAKFLTRFGSKPREEDNLPVAKPLEEAQSEPRGIINSIRKDGHAEALKTLAGTVVGTPGFMAPEQAVEDTADKVDERVDIYALGAILYNILTLRAPVEGGTQANRLERTVHGDITPPASFNRSSRRARRQKSTARPGIKRKHGAPVYLAHCPGGWIPEALASVAMKALSLEPAQRYATVRQLQKDVEAYQNGFATSAERAGFLRQARLLITRHRGASIAGITSILAMGILLAVGFWINLQARLAAEQAMDELILERTMRQQDRAESAPALAETARMLSEQGKYPSAITLAESALEYDPGLDEARLLYVFLLFKAGHYEQALKEAEQHAQRQSQDEEAERLVEFCRMARDRGVDSVPIQDLAPIAAQHDMPMLAANLAQSFDQKIQFYRQRLDVVWPGMGTNLSLTARSILTLKIPPSSQIMDLAPLRFVPLNELFITLASIRDLSPLSDMPLTRLELDRCSLLEDLTPLAGLRLTRLSLKQCPQVSDLTPLTGMPLNYLELIGTGVKSLEPIRGMSLDFLSLAGCRDLADLIPLAGMPLTHLDLAGCVKINDLSPLTGMPLDFLALRGTTVTDLRPLMGMKTLSEWGRGAQGGPDTPSYLLMNMVTENIRQEEFDLAEKMTEELIEGFEEVPVFAKAVKFLRQVKDEMIPAWKSLAEDPTRIPAEARTDGNGRRYLLGPCMTWQGARKIAEQCGGHLATIADQSEQVFVETMISPEMSAWMGGEYDLENEVWTWVSKEPWEYENWQVRKLAVNKSLRWPAMNDDGAWVVAPESQRKLFIMEWK